MLGLELSFWTISMFSSGIWIKRGLNMGISFSFSLNQTATVPDTVPDHPYPPNRRRADELAGKI